MGEKRGHGEVGACSGIDAIGLQRCIPSRRVPEEALAGCFAARNEL